MLAISCGAGVLAAWTLAVPGHEYVDASAGLQTPAMEGGDTEMEFGDVDGDGHVDLVSIGDHGSPFVNTQEHGVMVWFGDGAGTWSVVQTGNFGYGGVALGDVNGDGRMDVGYGMHHNYSGQDLGDQLLEVALGDGTGAAWTPWDDGLATNGETWGLFATDFADVDNDGDLDVGSISFGCCAGIHVYLNGGEGTWTQSFGFSGGNARSQFAFGDVDGDGNADFAAGHGDGTVYLGDGDGGFSLADANLPGPTWRRGVALGDVDDDGADDVAWAADAGVEVWAMTTPGEWRPLSGDLAVVGGFDRVQIADMNLDGHGDVLAFRDGEIAIHAGDGNGGWTPLATITTPEACDDAAFRAGTDVDHNGYPDLVVVSEEACDPWVGGRNRPRVYVEASVPETPFVTTVAPRPGAVLVAGSTRFVDWHGGVPAGAGGGTATIDLSTTGPDGPWLRVATAVPDNGRLQWTLPPDTPSSSACFLRITLATEPPAVAITPGAFTIAGGVRPGDVDGDGDVDFADLLLVLGAWGPCPAEGECPEDLDGDGQVTFADLLVVLANWG